MEVITNYSNDLKRFDRIKFSAINSNGYLRGSFKEYDSKKNAIVKTYKGMVRVKLEEIIEVTRYTEEEWAEMNKNQMFFPIVEIIRK